MSFTEMNPARLNLAGSFGLRAGNQDVSEVRIGTAGRWQQRVNLATNPSFEGTAMTFVTVRQNLATTPASYTPAASGPYPGLGAGPYTGSAEIGGVRQAIDPLALVGGTTYTRLLIEAGSTTLGPYFDGDTAPALRTNLAPDPRAKYSGGWWNGGTSTNTNVPTGGMDDGPWRQLTTTGLPTAADGVIDLYSMGTAGRQAAVVPGKQYTMSVDALIPHAVGNVAVRWFFRDASATTIGSAAVSGAVPAVTGWQRLSFTTTAAPAGAVVLWMNVRYLPGTNTVHQIGDVFGTSRILVEEGTNVLPYFDGDGTSTADGLAPSWTGPVNASTSVLTDPDLAVAWSGPVNASTSMLRGIALTVPAPRSLVAVVSSTRWAASGSRSLRLIALLATTAVESYAPIVLAPTPGSTWRASAVCHRGQSQITPGAYGGRMQVRRDGGVVIANGVAAPNVPGDHLLSLTWTVPDGVTTHQLRLYSGSLLGDADVWWDSLIIEDVTDGVPDAAGFFDGATPSSAQILHHWTGPVNGSTSVATEAWSPA